MKSRFLLTSLGLFAALPIHLSASSAYAQMDIGQVMDAVNDAASEGGGVPNSPPPQDGQPSEVVSEQAAQENAPQDNAAQDQVPVQTDTSQQSVPSLVSEDQARVQMTQKVGLLPAGIDSVIFTYWEYTALMDAKKSRQSTGVQRGVTEDELSRALQEQNNGEAKPVPPPEEREITLGGIVFTDNKDWTIWLNGQRVTPDALPKEIIDLKVTRHYIDMKWLDTYTQKLYPIRLRAHQRFNLDARIFLPG